MARLAIDFGTSNTAAAAAGFGIIPLESDASTMPSAVFFDAHGAPPVLGSQAIEALIDGQEGRFLRALKSVLGQPVLREARLLGGKRMSLLEVTAKFLADIRCRAEHATAATFETVLSGRPVRFHSRNDTYNAQAELDLTEAYHMAGFTDVQYLPEPEAAALISGGVAEGYGLVVDIGGGTSDYAVFAGPEDRIKVIASHGIRLGGTDFDRLLNIDRVMPALGMGTMLRNEIGPGQNEAPRALFRDLATWEKIPFQYAPQHVRDVKRMARLAVDPGPWKRLVDVLDLELAHDIAHAVEQAKIAVNMSTTSDINLGFLKKNSRISLDAEDMRRVLEASALEIQAAALDAVAAAGRTARDIRRIVMVGGTSLIAGVEQRISDAFPEAEIDRSDAFTAIVDGLARAAARMG